MPYFPDKNCLFIHIPKCAGTYVEHYLGIPVGWGLNKKPSNKKHIIYKLNQLGRNILNKNTSLNSWLQRRMLFGYIYGGYAVQHATINEILSLKLIDESILEGATIFSVHRHPVDRLISVYYYWGFNKKMNLNEFCQTIVSKPWLSRLSHTQLTHLRPQHDFVELNGDIPNWIKLIPICEVENYLYNLSQKNGWATPKTAMFNSSNRKKRRACLSQASLELIYTRYQKDFEIFGYTIDSFRD